MLRWVGIAIILVCLAGLAWISLPAPNKSVVYQAKDPVWSLKIEQPVYMRSGDSGTLTVDVTPPDIKGTGQDTGAVSVRVDFPGLFQGVNEATQMVPMGTNARFPWTLSPAKPGQYEGRIWIYNGLEKTLLNVRTVQVEVRGPDTTVMYGLRVALLAGAAAGLWLAFSRSSKRAI
jgi:hypothetical protein